MSEPDERSSRPANQPVRRVDAEPGRGDGCAKRRPARAGRHGHALAEYVTLLVILVAALVAGQRFFKALIMGRWQSAVDTFGFGRQYEPGRTAISQ